MFRECWTFYKLATESAQEEYTQALNQCRAQLSTPRYAISALKTVGQFIAKWSASPYYTVQDGLDLIQLSFQDKDNHYSLDTLASYFKMDIIARSTLSGAWPDLSVYLTAIGDAFVTISLEKLYQAPPAKSLSYLEELMGPHDLSVKQYAKIEKGILSYLIHKIEEAEDHHAEALLLQEFIFLYRRDWMPETLINLAKKVGIDFYARFLRETHAVNNPIESGWDNPVIVWYKNNKEEITQYDIGEWFYYLQAMHVNITHQEFEFVLKRCTKKAIQFLQGFVYNDQKSGRFFMLDESLQPMNSDLDAIPWPEKFYPTTIAKIKPQSVQEKWKQIFDDYKVIPNS